MEIVAFQKQRAELKNKVVINRFSVLKFKAVANRRVEAKKTSLAQLQIIILWLKVGTYRKFTIVIIVIWVLMIVEIEYAKERGSLPPFCFFIKICRDVQSMVISHSKGVFV